MAEMPTATTSPIPVITHLASVPHPLMWTTGTGWPLQSQKTINCLWILKMWIRGREALWWTALGHCQLTGSKEATSMSLVRPTSACAYYVFTLCVCTTALHQKQAPNPNNELCLALLRVSRCTRISRKASLPASSFLHINSALTSTPMGSPQHHVTIQQINHNELEWLPQSLVYCLKVLLHLTFERCQLLTWSWFC